MSLTTASFVLLLLRDKEHPMHNWHTWSSIDTMLEPKKTRTVRVNFRCWPTVGITTIYSFVTPSKPHHTEEPPPNYTQNTNKMSCQMHFSTMAAAVVPWPPWWHPACTEAYNNQPRLLAIVSARGGHGRQGWDAATVSTDAMVWVLTSAASC